MELIGKAIVVSNVIQVTDSFKKRELVIKTDEQYPSEILIEFVQDKVDLLDKVSIGEDLKVHINISGRSWANTQGETKYFNSIKGWRIEKLEQTSTQQEPASQTFQPSSNFKEEEHDDLPF